MEIRETKKIQVSLQAEVQTSTSLVLPGLTPILSEIIRNGKSYHFTLDHLPFQDDIRSLISEEIGKRYPETGLDYANYVLQKSMVEELVESKKILVATFRNELAGFTVLTPKSDYSIKFGPTIVKSVFRNNGLAGQLREFGELLFSNYGFLKAYSTCRADNKPAVNYVKKKGYSLVASLPNQYEMGVTELVFDRQLISRFTTPSFIKEGSSRKRGGSFKIGHDIIQSDSLELLDNVLNEVTKTNDVHRVFFLTEYDEYEDMRFRKLGYKLNNHINSGKVLYGNDLK